MKEVSGIFKTNKIVGIMMKTCFKANFASKKINIDHPFMTEKVPLNPSEAVEVLQTKDKQKIIIKLKVI